jgi:hypothetical protein
LADKQIIAQNFASMDRNIVSQLDGPQTQNIEGISQIQFLEYFLAISYAMINDATNGWLVNMHWIMFIEQIEVLGLLWFYRRAFRPQIMTN